nr:hypothetical protein [Tanacetum cinerariifolium]
MEDTLLELLEVCRQKEFYCMRNDVDDLIESALNSKLFSINLESQRLDNKKQEVKNIVEQPTKRGTRIDKSLQNFSVKKSSTSLNNTSQISPVQSDKVIKSSVKNLLPIPREYEVASDDENQHYFNAESDLIESLSNHDTLFDSSLKFDYLEEFSGVLMPTSIADEERIRREHEEYINLLEKLFTINSCPRPLENFHANTIVETLPTSPIPVEDGDSQKEEIDIFTGMDELLPPSIESDDYDSKGDIHFLEELLVNDSILIPENKSSNSDHHDDPLFPRPPPEPPDVEFYFDFEPNSGEVISAVINNINELNEDECFDPRGEINVFANVEDDDYFPFIFVIRIFLLYLIYPEVSPLLLAAESEDTILTLTSSFRAGGILLGWNFHMLQCSSKH